MAWADEDPTSRSSPSVIECSPIKDELPVSEYSLQNSCLQGSKQNLVLCKFAFHRVKFTFRRCFMTLTLHLYLCVPTVWGRGKGSHLCSEALRAVLVPFMVHRQSIQCIPSLCSVSADCKYNCSLGCLV